MSVDLWGDESSAIAERPPLWPHQQAGLDELSVALDAGEKAVCVTSPTGGGKTTMISTRAESVIERGGRLALFTNRRILTGQASGKLSDFGLDHGIMAAGHDPKLWARVQICSLQTIGKRVFGRQAEERDDAWELPNVDEVHIDEAHSNTADTAQRIIKHYKSRGVPVVGWTATPVGLAGIYDKIVVAGRNSDLRRCGALVRCDVYAPTEPDMRGVKFNKVGEYVQDDMRKRVMQCTVFGDVFTHWRRLNPDGRPTLMWAPGVKESEWFAEQWRREGVTAGHIDGETPEEERKELFAASKEGRIKVLCSCGVLREGVDCLSSDTEILTPSGWKQMNEISTGDTMYALNRESERLEVVPVQRHLVRDIRPGEKMFTIRGQHVDIRTSEGHEFHIKYADPNLPYPRRSKTWLTKKGRELADRRSDYILPISAETEEELPGVPLTDDEIRFIAWFMTDGYWTQEYVCISQSKIYHHEIRALLTRLGFDFRERSRPFEEHTYATADSYFEFLVPKGTHGGSMKRNGWHDTFRDYLDKDGSELLHKMSRRQFKVFWDELLKGDGSFQENKAGHLTTCRKTQADLYMHLAVVRGYAINCWHGTTERGTDVYLLNIRDKQWLCSRPSDKRAAKIALLDPEQREQVWCVTNRLGTLVARRNGKVAIIGNCPWISHGILCQPCGALSTYLQIVGRILRADPESGKTLAIMQDHAGAWHRHGSPNWDREWQLGDTDKSIAKRVREQREQGKEQEPICCPRCGGIRRTGAECPFCGHSHVKSVRAVRMVDGTLKKMVGPTVKVKRQKSAEQRAWDSALFAAGRSRRTVEQARGIYFHATGQWPPEGLRNMPSANSTDWQRRVGDLYPFTVQARRRRGAA